MAIACYWHNGTISIEATWVHKTIACQQGRYLIYLVQWD